MTPTLVPAVAAVGLGTYISAGLVRDIYFALMSRKWPTTSGKVTALDIVHNPAPRSSYDSALVAYEYEVRGVRYASKRIDYAGRGGGWSARRYLRRYHEGGNVSVRYDPSEPKRAVLETGVTLGNFLRLLVGFAVIGLGLLFLLAS